jgi:hypothetical protein
VTDNLFLRRSIWVLAPTLIDLVRPPARKTQPAGLNQTTGPGQHPNPNLRPSAQSVDNHPPSRLRTVN